jgi:hypothetical protein
MPLWVINQIDHQILGIKGFLRLSAPDPNVIITDSVKYFGNIGAGESAYTSLDGYNFMVSAACTNGYALPLQLVCTDTLDSAWTSDLELRVGTPILISAEVSVFDPPPGGNNNGKIDPGETVLLAIGIRNQGLGNGYNVTAHLISTDNRLVILDSIGTYGTILHDTIIFNVSDRFQVNANSSIPRETQITCTLNIYTTGYPVQKRLVLLDIGRVTITDPIPDGPRTPPLYYAYDNIDTFYVEHPHYEWVEIKTIGTRLGLGDDQTVCISLPAGFGPWKFYGQRYTQLSICSNGWIAPGSTTTDSWTNRPLPHPGSPNGMVCANWDDLLPSFTGVGGVYYYHNAANHKFIIEYDSVPYLSSSVREKFEIIIYDTTLAAFDGHNEILVQYMTANQWDSSTVGIEDPTNSIAILGLFNDTLHRACAPWAPGKVIKYTTDSMVTVGITEDIAQFQLKPTLNLLSNPSRRFAKIRFQVAQKGRVSLSVYDISGRFICNLFDSKSQMVEPRIYDVRWNGKDFAGRKVASGIYFYRLKTDYIELTKKAILLQ